MIDKIYKNGFLKNIILNIMASSLPIVLLQIVLLPLLSRNMGAGEYGLVVTVISVLNVIPSTLGNSLNNIRLLHRNDYKENEVKGDFSIIFFRNSIIVLLSVILLCTYYFKKDFYGASKEIHLFLIAFLALVWMGKEYLIVAFYASLWYDKILISNFLLSVGYIVGYFFYVVTSYWESIYIVGYIFSLIYIIKNSSLWKEPFIKTELFYHINKDYIIYVASCMISRLITYSDKMLLYPLLGGEQVTIYYVATLTGKVILLVITPISNVIFSYLTKAKHKNRERFFMALKLGSVMCIIGYFLCMCISKPILTLIYPAYAERAVNYVFITVGTTMIRVFEGIVNPFILCFVTMKWQIIINLFTLIIYVGVSFILLYFMELYGFCIGAFIAELAKLFLMLMIYRFSNR